jgi:hypothetical protein
MQKYRQDDRFGDVSSDEDSIDNCQSINNESDSDIESESGSKSSNLTNSKNPFGSAAKQGSSFMFNIPEDNNETTGNYVAIDMKQNSFKYVET